jgi:hypothetical protein
MTFESSPPTGSPQMELELTSSVEASPARTYQRREGSRPWRASAAAYGRNTPVLLANYDRNSSSWRTSQHCLVEGLQTYSETWPRSGMMRSGTAYQLPPLVRLTDETAFGLWPTPVTDATMTALGRSDTKGMHSLSLSHCANRGYGPRGETMWPTPTVADSKNVGNNGSSQFNLHKTVNGPLNPTWVEWLMGFPLGWTDLKG